MRCDSSAFGSALYSVEDWVMTLKKGAVALLANSSIGVMYYLRRFLILFIIPLCDSVHWIYVHCEFINGRKRKFHSAPWFGHLNLSHMEAYDQLWRSGISMFSPRNLRLIVSFDVAWVSLTVFAEYRSRYFPCLNWVLSFSDIGRVDQIRLDFKMEDAFPNGTTISFSVVKSHPFLAFRYHRFFYAQNRTRSRAKFFL